MTPKQLAALRKNAAKGRAKLAQMRKAGLIVGNKNPAKEKMTKHSIPLAMVPAGKLPVAAKAVRKERVADRETVDALAQLIVATFAEFQRRKGAL